MYFTEDKDLRRFHSYEALFSHNMDAKVITYVIYTGGIEKTKGELDCGMYTYRVVPIYMGQKNADGIIQRLKEKQATGDSLTEDELAQLCLTPLMGGTMNRKDKIKDGILLAKEEHNDMSDKVMAMLYTLADKFLDGIELKEIKEAMTMTRLGQMIMDDGIKIGEMRGEARGEARGCESGEKKMAALYEKLQTVSRGAEYLQACRDEKYRKQLMDEFGLK